MAQNLFLELISPIIAKLPGKQAMKRVIFPILANC
jgi:hypothetical protein